MASNKSDSTDNASNMDVESGSHAVRSETMETNKEEVIVHVEKEKVTNKEPSQGLSRRSLNKHQTDHQKSVKNELNNKSSQSKMKEVNVTGSKTAIDSMESSAKQIKTSVQEPKVSNPAPKGLRPTVKRGLVKQASQKHETKAPVRIDHSKESRDITVLLDVDPNEATKSQTIISRTAISSNKLLSQSVRSNATLNSSKPREALSSGSKLLQDLDQSSQHRTRSQSKLLDNSQVKVGRIYLIGTFLTQIWGLNMDLIFIEKRLFFQGSKFNSLANTLNDSSFSKQHHLLCLANEYKSLSH